MHVWRNGAAGDEHVLVDPNTWEHPHSTLANNAVAASPDGKKVAYRVARNNGDEATLYVKDLDTGEVSSVDTITGVKYGGISWAADSSGFWYTHCPNDPTVSADMRPGLQTLRFHRLGEPAGSDAVVFPASNDPTSFRSAWRSGPYLFARVTRGWGAEDLYFRRADAAHDAPFTCLAAGREAGYLPMFWNERIWLATSDGAPNGRLLQVDPAHPARERWVELVPERPDAVLKTYRFAHNKLILTYVEDACTQIEIRNVDGTSPTRVELPGHGFAEVVTAHRENGYDVLVRYESLTQPPETFRLDVETGALSPVTPPRAGHGSEQYTTEQVFFHSKDGTRVPMFVARRKDTPLDGKAPTILSGYGGFASNRDPAYIPHLPAWLDRGGIFALVNLRGGGEYGQRWHQDGMRERKQNVFDDCIAAAEFLCRQGYTSPDHLAVKGGSNGGLLVSAVTTQRPDLFRAAICSVPLVDMLRYPYFASGRTWIPEYGDPEQPADFDVLRSYSPYHHIQRSPTYPAMLVITRDTDDRVDPMHARKLAAALQAAKTKGPVLLAIDRHAGHGGTGTVSGMVDTAARDYAFLFHELGRPVDPKYGKPSSRGGGSNGRGVVRPGA